MDNTQELEIEIEATPTYHNHLISDKVIDPKSPNFGKKGQSHYLKNGDQWYFQPKDDEDFYRVKWYQLDSNVSEGSYGKARYIGLNASIVGKVGELVYKNRQWIFNYDTETYKLNSPDSVEIL